MGLLTFGVPIVALQTKPHVASWLIMLNNYFNVSSSLGKLEKQPRGSPSVTTTEWEQASQPTHQMHEHDHPDMTNSLPRRHMCTAAAGCGSRESGMTRPVSQGQRRLV